METRDPPFKFILGCLVQSSRSAGPMMMGKQAAAGPFTPAVVLLRGAVGEKQFNQIRGKVQPPPRPRVTLFRP